MIEYIKQYALIHKKIVNSLYSRFLITKRGRAYVFFFNLRSRFLGRSVRVRLLENGTPLLYEVMDSTLKKRIVFPFEKNANIFYARGIEERCAELARTYFMDQVDFKSGDIVMDCGANIGDLLLWFENENTDIEYIGFEPGPQDYECLKQNVSPHTVHNIGLWNTEGDLNFYVSPQGGDSSLIEPPVYDEKIIIQTKRLENFVDQPVKFLKLEAEGAEPEILEGLGDKIHDIQYIAADLGFERGVNAESTLIPVTNFLLQKGFTLKAIRHGRISALFENQKMTPS